MLILSWYENQSTTWQVKIKLLQQTQEQRFELDSVGGVP
jgi:hypothetical protein